MSLIDRISGFFRKKNQDSRKLENNINVREYIGKFVRQNNADIGESVAFHNNMVVVKSKEYYMSIPLEKITANTDVIAVGDFDRDESLRFGKEWSEKRDTLKFDQNGIMILDNKKVE